VVLWSSVQALSPSIVDSNVAKYWRVWSCKSNFWLYLYETAVNRVDVRGGTSRAGEGVKCRDGLGYERTEVDQACHGTKWYYVGQRVGRGVVEFSNEIP